MSEVKHTPTPWRVHDEHQGIGEVWYGYDYMVCQTQQVHLKTRNHSKSNEIRQANAEFIVRACNAHESLCEALEIICNASATIKGVTLGDIGKAIAALSRARGGSNE